MMALYECKCGNSWMRYDIPKAIKSLYDLGCESCEDGTMSVSRWVEDTTAMIPIGEVRE